MPGRHLIHLLVSLFKDVSRAFVAQPNDLCGNRNAAQELKDQVTCRGTKESVRGGAATAALLLSVWLQLVSLSSSYLVIFAFILALTQYCVLLSQIN